METWLDLLFKIFEVAIVPIIGALAGYLISFVNAKKENLKEKTNNEVLWKYLDMLGSTIEVCVNATTQTYVDAIKKAGKFDEEAQKTAMSLTFNAVMDILADEAKTYLKEAVGDLDKFVTNQIEAVIASQKN